MAAVLAILSMEVGFLAVTGVILYIVYRPPPREALMALRESVGSVTAD